MIERISDVSVLHLSGEVGPSEMSGIVETINSLLKGEWIKIILDFGDVTHVHYSSLPSLIAKKIEAQTAEGDLKIVNISDYHRKIFQFAGAEKFLDENSSLSEAVLSFATAYQ